MARHAQCCLPTFGTTLNCPKRPLSIKTRVTLSQSAKLLSALDNNSLEPLLKTAWGLLLYRYTGLEDICFGYQHHGVRGSSSPHSLNTEKLSTCNISINESDTVRSLLQKFEKRNDSNGYADLDETNHNNFLLFSTVVMVRVCGDRAKGGASVQPVLPNILSENCRARLHVKVLQEDVCIFLEWWNTEISVTQMESVARYFEHLLDQVISSREINAIDAGCFLEHDWSRIRQFNSVLPEDHDRCIHNIILEKARTYPQREAVCAWDGSFTYEVLDRLASKLAFYLQAHGVGAEARVALCFDKSKWNVVAMLGVLKAGGAFVPLDPTHPTSRLRSLVQSVNAKVILCSRDRVDIAKGVEDNAIPLDDDAFEKISFPQSGFIQQEVSGNNAAYLIFTSGSTGQPKGTLLEHKAFVSAAMAYGRLADMDSECRILHFAAHTFDASLFESIAPLLFGGCVCIPSDEERLNNISQAINRMRINVLCLTPSFVRCIDPSSIPGAKTIILMGEAMSRTDLETWAHIKLVNAYGPTEAAICAAINPHIHMASDSRDIGLPTGVRFWVVSPNDHNQLVPVGSPGELLLEGPTLARCYINDPKKTDEVFIHNPAWANNNPSCGVRRFYKTGDLVRYNSEAGSLIFIGRKDTQIKLHGQRVELGEIEANISTLSRVKHCLAFLRKSQSEQGKVVAVVSLQCNSTSAVPLKQLGQLESIAAISELRQKLSKRIPSYMVPTTWLCVEALPLLPSGKLNRKEIVSWANNQIDELSSQTAVPVLHDTAYEAPPRRKVEDQLASTWSRVLAIPQNTISHKESFLTFGGDSIAAITCMGHCKKQGLSVSVQDILQSESIRDLATRVKEINRPVEYQEAVDEPFGLSPIQKLHFMARKEGHGYFNQSIRTRLYQRVGEHDLRRAIEVIVKRHSMLRARLVPNSDRENLQLRITGDVNTSYRFRVHGIEQQAEMDEAISASQLCIDAFEGPLLSVDLFVAKEDCFLSMVAHHLVIDIVSWRIILEDLEDILLRPNFSASHTNSLPFSSWCRLQSKRTQCLDSELEDVPTPNLGYWGLEDQVVTYGDVICETFELGLDDSHTILLDSHKSLGTEPIDIFLASLLHAFGQIFKDRELPAIFNEGHGREVWDPSIDISRTVGWFTTVFPITLPDQLTDDPVETVVLVKDLRRRVSDNGRQYFANLMSASAQNGRQKYPCPMEITFNYVGQHRDLQRQDGLFQLIDQMAGETGQGGGASDFGRDTARFGLFEISALAVSGRLRFSFSFSKYMKYQEAIRSWIGRCGDMLRYLGKTLPSLPTRPTLSDYPMLSLTYPTLEAILSERLPSLGLDSPDIIEDIYPCSRMQQGILLAQSKDSSLYAVHDTYEVRSSEDKPNAGRLAEAWRMVVSRHAILRTLFVGNLTSHDLFSQVVLRRCEPSIYRLNCADGSEVLSTFDNQPPATYNEFRPQHRLSICEAQNNKLFLRIEMSHAAMDAVSIAIILGDLRAAYDGNISHHRPLFSNYMRYLHDSPKDGSINYWRRYLAYPKPCLFPTLTEHKAVPETRLGTVRSHMNSFSKLQSLCEETRMTLSTAFTAAWGLTLRLFCNSNDVCFSYMTSLRESPVKNIESMVGPVINLLACRMRVTKNDTLKDVLQRVQNDIMEQLPHNSLSFIDIQHELKLSDSALFNTGISFQKSEYTGVQSTSGLRFTRISPVHDPAEYPVFVNVLASDKAADIELNYWTDTLCDEQAENVSSIFLTCLENIAHHLDDQIDGLETLSDWNKQRIRKWNRQPIEETDILVHDIVWRKAASHSDVPAIMAWDETLSYADLERFSSCLAAYLMQLGIRTGTLVPIYLGRSAWQVVVVLAVLKAGGTCVPRDGTHSASSLDEWLSDNGATMALTSPSGVESLEGRFPIVLSVDKSLFRLLSEPSAASSYQMQSFSDGAYVVFDANGNNDCLAVTLDHRSILARATAFASATQMDSTVKTFLATSPTSDMFLQSLASTLMHGGCVCIPKSGTLSQLPKSINEMNANFVSLTPTAASLLQPSEIPSLQRLALFGEASTEEARRVWSEKCHVYSFFGTTECSSTCLQGSTPETLGNLLMNCKAVGCCPWVVDIQDSARLVPVGCVGELVIEGPGVHSGYLWSEQDTERKSIDHDSGSVVGLTERPYWILPRARQQMCRTGLLVRYNSNGTLVYLGKRNDEKKHEAEMTALEVEKALEFMGLEGYKYLVQTVDLEADGSSETRVAVFIISLQSQKPASTTEEEPVTIFPHTSSFRQLVATIQAHLITSLPADRVTNLYFPISGLPLTPLGTINRPLLRNLVQSLSKRSLVEYDLRAFEEYWSGLLAKSPVGRQLRLQQLSSQPSTASKMIDNAIRLDWNGSLHKHNARDMILCAWALAMYSYTQNDDIIFGELLADTQEEDSTLRATVLPRRIQLRESSSIICVLEQISSSLARAKPFEKTSIASIKNLNADTARASDTESVISISPMDAKQQSLYMEDVEKELNVDAQPFMYPLAILCSLNETGVDIAARYDGKVLYHSQIEQLLSLFGKFLGYFSTRTNSNESVPDIASKGHSLHAFIETTTFWREYLSEVEPCLFPALSPGEEHFDRLATQSLSLYDTSEIQSICGRLAISPSLLLQIIWALVLRCYTGLEEVTFGYHCSAKKTAAGILPCRFSLNDGLKLQDVLMRVKDDTKRILGHQLSLYEVSRVIKSEDSRIFNTAFIYKETAPEVAGLSSVVLNKTNNELNPYTIVVNASVSSTCVEVNFDYQPTSFSDNDIGNIIDCFECTLNSAFTVLGSDRLVRDIEFFGPRSRRSLATWQSAPLQRPVQCAHAVILEQVLVQPLAPAICSWDESFTYTQLDLLSTRLARYLMDQGVGSEVFVGLCFEKSAWAVIAQVAVLKAGGAFASLDPIHPESRLQTLIEDIAAPIVLCSSRYLDKASRICKASLSVSQDTLDNLPISSGAPKASNVNIENAAYAIFTSGTTGKPKVTVLEHAALVTASKSFANTFGIGSDTRALQFSSYTFDVSIFETIIVLMTGGCVCIPSEEERLNDLSGAIRRMKANLMSCTPSVISTLNPSDVPTLTTIICGGEKITESQIACWTQKRLFNAYGPSEATIIATADLKTDGSGRRLGDDSNSIGTAVCGRAWIVDPRNSDRLLPVGAVGELVLEGCNVARGYLNNKEKTKEVFIERPQWYQAIGLRDGAEYTGRMYRTGDLVRYKSDGNICFISRMDTQVKLNGQRIELEEIEQQCTLLSPDGTQVAVDIVVPETKAVAKGLAAFFTLAEKGRSRSVPEQDASASLLLGSSDGSERTIQKLHSSLCEVLPQTMIPRFYFPVRYLPLGTTGKLDRKALRAIAQGLSGEQLKPYLISASDSGRILEQPAESVLRKLWAEVLDIEPGFISDGDSFFGLGGDSFSAMKLVGAARSCDVSLTVAKIYEYPVLADMAKCYDNNTNALERLDLVPFSLVPDSLPLQDVMDEVTEQCGITEDLISDIYPCSALQEGLFTLSMKNRGAYVARAMYRLAENVDLEKFKASWQQVADEFDILRTRIVHTEVAGFLQVVLQRELISWTIKTTLDSVLGETMEDSGALLAEYSIVQLGPSNRYFVWTVNHALYDGWNIGPMLKRAEDIYFGSSASNSTIPYKFFINHLLQQDMQESDRFWKTYLGGLSCEHFPPQRDTDSSSIRVGKTQRSSIDISRRPGTADITVPELIRAAWALVLSTHTGSGDVCFGETLAGRNISMPGITDVAGPVLTTVPMRIKVDNKLSLTQYLRDVRQLLTSMIPHQHSGLQRIQKLSGDAALACNFQNLLVIQSGDVQLNKSIWSSQDEQIQGDFFTHSLVVECQISGSRLDIRVHHDEVVLGCWQAERLIWQFTYILEQIVNVPEDSAMLVGGLDITSPEDKREIALWNQRQVTSVEKCAHDIIRGNALAQPHAPAICSWDGELTYEELLSLASSFATYLTSCGVCPEKLVPVCLEKSLWTMVTILSVLLAGGAFVPLDPSHPTSRHKEILAEIEADIILCSPQLRSRYMGSVSTIIPISKETITAYSAIGAKERCSVSATPSNIAYAIFTSGSTGKPKGIIIDHRAMCSSIITFAPVVHLTKNCRVFQFASLTFDAAILETLGVLMVGGCVCVPGEDERMNDIPSAIQRMNVNWAFLTPAVANILDPSSVPSIQTVTCGGEALPPDVVAKWGHRVRFLEVYGPTETAIFALINSDFVNRGSTCIGYGFPNTLTWIIDPNDHDRLTPLGAVGELALEGPVLAREYLKNPIKTADSFVEQPAWVNYFPVRSPTTRRIYKTGDLVKYNSDGSIEYLGRKDHQVKLNGQRMELGEIEHRLLESQNVRSAVVILPKAGPLRNKLVAVVCLKSLTSDTSIITTGACELVSQKDMLKVGHQESSQIKASIGSQLPPYMVPQAWAVVTNIPMLVSGKMDRKRITSWLEQLEDAQYNQIMQVYDGTSPEPVEEDIAKKAEDTASAILRNIVAHVLNLPANKVDTKRSFIYLGGDSITGMAVVSRARKRGFSLPLNRILQSQSLDEIAAMSSEVQPLQMKDEVEPSSLFRLSPIQELFFRSSPTAPKGDRRFNQSMTVRVSRRLKPAVLNDAIRAVVRNHSVFRARFSQLRDGTWQQMITNEIDPSYKFYAHSVKSSSDMMEKIASTQSSLDIQKGPLLGADLFEINGQQVLFLTASHLCVDVVSWRIVLQNLEEFVDTGAVSSDVPLSFQSWCNSQLENSRTIDKASTVQAESPDLAYWGMSQMHNDYGHVKMESFILSRPSTAFLSRECHKVLKTETIEVLIAAVVLSFSRVFTDRSVPTIYNEGHGREPWGSLDPSATVGWFTTLNPLHVRGSSDFLDIMRRIKDTRRRNRELSRALFAHNVLHFDNINWSNKFPVPLEILFNYLGHLQQLEREESIFQHYGDVFKAETMDAAGDMGPRTLRFALFEITAIIVKEELHMSFTYHRSVKHQAQIQAWMAECKRVLESEILNVKHAAPEPTLSDFPLLPVTYDELQELSENVLPKLGIADWDQVEDIYPCSPIQNGILFSQLREPQEYIFNVIFEVSQPEEEFIDLTKLKNAWTTVVARHPTLRTVFIDSCYKGGTFDQIVVKKGSEATVEIECDDLDAFSKLDAISLRNNKSQKFYHRVVFCKTSSGRILVKFEMNHVVIDGGSFSILLNDLALAYNDQLPPGTGPLFSDYIRYIKDDSATEALEYWKQHLSGLRECKLPVVEGGISTRQLGTQMVPFDRYNELQRLCERNSITLANLILAAWAVFLRSQTHSDDVCFGYPSTGRDSPVSGVQEMVGILINTLCCRVRFCANQTLLGISKLVQDQHLESLAHQRASLAEVQHALGRHGKPLFNTCVSIQNHSAEEVETAGITYKFQKAHDPSEYPVTANVETARGREGILLRYWADVVSETEASAFARSVARILTYFVEDPFTPIQNLKINFKDSLALSEQMMDQSALERVVDERIKVILHQMLEEGRLAESSLIKKHGANLSTGVAHVTKDVKHNNQGQVATRKESPEALNQALSTECGEVGDFAKQLWGIWGRTLGLPETPIKYRSSFFNLGGDSITAMQMVRSAREEGLKLSVANVFRTPVFEDLLALINSGTKPVVPSVTVGHKKIEAHVEEKPVLAKSEPSQEISGLKSVPVELHDTCLRAAVCPKVGVFKGGIVDILPVTDFQARSLTATMFESRWMLNYFYLEGMGSLDIRRLRESLLRVVDAFDILRTVFVCFHGQFFQVVLRKIRPDIFVYETDKSLDEYTKSLQQRDRNQPPAQGQQHVQFYVVRKVNSDKHRILIRMSHAQFDGVCLPKIMAAIKMAYEGSPVSPSSFLSYMRLLPGTITPEHYQHWTTLLRGSRMTQIIQRETPNTFQHVGGFTEQKRVIEVPSTATENVTVATVMQSAWAVTLAKLCAQDDVVFGLTVSGRNAVPGVENVVGPCLNNIPVRVTFKDRWTALDLFRFLQDQQVSNMTYESLGFREIVRRCTDWPESTFFTTSVLHQNLDYEGQMQLDNNTYRMGGLGVIDSFTDLMLFSKPVAGHPTQITVSVGYSLKGPIHPSFASTVLDMVCDTTQSLVANPNIALPSPSTLRSLPPRLIDDTPVNSGSDSVLLSSLKNRSLSEILVHSDLITRIWQQVLPPKPTTGRPQTSFQLDSSFFRQGGDIVNMAQVVWLLEQETGLYVRIEELLKHSTFLGQMAVLALYMAKRDADAIDPTDAAPAYDSVNVSPAVPVSGPEVLPLTSARSEWSALGRARSLAKRITKLGSLSTRV